MRQEDRARLDLGLDRCIACAHGHVCPPDCPYTDDVVEGRHYDCQGILLMDARQRIRELEEEIDFMREELSPRLLRPDEIGRYTGAAWLEVWCEADDGDPEFKEIMPVGVCEGNMIHQDGCHAQRKNLVRQYNKPYGMRLWINDQPTEEQREATPWKS